MENKEFEQEWESISKIITTEYIPKDTLKVICRTMFTAGQIVQNKKAIEDFKDLFNK